MKSSLSLTTLLVALATIATTNAFAPTSAMTSRTTGAAMRSSSLYNKAGEEEESTPGGDSYDGDIDWDAEWAKVVKENKSNASTKRPGSDFYKNDAQRAAVKASRAASEQISKVKIVKPDVNLKMLTGDAKFWIAILAVISIGLALISAPDMSSYSSSNESFYI